MIGLLVQCNLYVKIGLECHAISSFHNTVFILFSHSEKRPSRGDLIVLVAHNDDPTGKFDS